MRSSFHVVAACALALMAASCTSESTISTTAPSTAKCQVSIESSMSTAPSAGANGSVTVTTTRDCTWDASSGVNWIALTSTANGQGSGTVSYRVEPNGVHAARNGTIDVNGTTVTLTQEAAPCRFTVSPLNSSVSASAANVTVTVDTLSGCAWTAVSQAPWIHVSSGASASASGPVAIAVDANGGGARSGTVTIAGQTVTISQAEPTPTPPPVPCTYMINPAAYSAPAAGATGSVAVTTGATCPWTATSNAAWITFTGVPSATGNGNLGFSVAANAGPARSGTATVAGQTFTVTQAAAGCTYAISPMSQSVDSSGGTGGFGVTAPSWCSWTASSGASWISMPGGGSGTGNGTVAFSVAANTAAARTSTITVGGQTFTITQAAAACTFGISPAGQSVDSSGGSGSFAVTASSWCAWTASAGAPWISITGGASGTGNATVAFSVAANAGAARSGAITVGGQTFTVSQTSAPPPCTYSISPPSQSADYPGGTGTVAVTVSAPSCPWTATSNNADWLTVTSGASGTGNGSVGWAAAANGGPARTGTLTIGGQTFTLTQAAAPPTCTFSISPPSQDLPASGGGGTVTITASAPGCGWTAMSNAAWLTITSAASGTGSGTVTFTAAPNGDGMPRTGTMSIAGQTFTVNESVSHDD